MGAEVPNVVWVPADPSNYRPRPQAQQGGPYRLIVIHITSGHGDPYGTASMWQQPSHDGKHTSAHFVVGQDGTTLQCVPLVMAAQHAHDANAYSIGIEHCAREPRELGVSDPGLPPSAPQLRASARLVAYLLKAAGLPPTRDYVQGHAEADPKTTHTGCPDAAPWPWDDYMDMVAKEYGAIGGQAVG